MSQGFANRPIPIVTRPSATSAIRRVPVDPSDRRAGEPLVDLKQLGIAGDNYYARTDGANPPYRAPIAGAIPLLLARKSVAERLVLVNRELESLDLEVYVVDAYRPIACQLGIWNFFWSKFRRSRPSASEAELEAVVSKYVSDPRGARPAEPGCSPPHATGGALDLTLRRRSTGALLDMGTHIDDARRISHTDHFERLLQRGEISPSDPRLQHRRQLYWSMISQGFTNYSYEYWHFDYGDQLYILSLQRQKKQGPAAAFYSYVEQP